MKQIVVISGKGGTGKTVLVASLAVLAKRAVFADCDVDAADLHLLLNPEIKERHEFRSGKTAKIDRKFCQECGKCIVICRFNAISEGYRVDSISCEGCGVCSTKYGPMVHAKLGIAEENSGKLVTLVKQKAKKIAEEENKDYVIVDGPPGIGCPVIASLANADLALIVTEPTLSGIHDMERIADVAKHFGIHTQVVINKYDINLENTQGIKRICQTRDIEVLAQLPFSEEVSRALVKGVPIVKFCSDLIAKDIIALWEKIKQRL